MKSVPLVFVFALTLAGFAVACGPEQTYCYDEHTTCEEAREAKIKKAADDKAAEEAAKSDAGISDSGATVLGG